MRCVEAGPVSPREEQARNDGVEHLRRVQADLELPKVTTDGGMGEVDVVVARHDRPDEGREHQALSCDVVAEIKPEVLKRRSGTDRCRSPLDADRVHYIWQPRKEQQPSTPLCR